MRRRPDQYHEAGRRARTGLVGVVAGLQRARKKLGCISLCSRSECADERYHPPELTARSGGGRATNTAAERRTSVCVDRRMERCTAAAGAMDSEKSTRMVRGSALGGTPSWASPRRRGGVNSFRCFFSGYYACRTVVTVCTFSRNQEDHGRR